MNIIIKTLVTALLCVATATSMAQSDATSGATHKAHQEMHHHADATSGATHEAPQGMPHHQAEPMHMHHDMPHGMPHDAMRTEPIQLQPVKMCYMPQTGMFAVIDSIDCAVDLVVMRPDTIIRIGHYQTDNIHKRHDLKNILRPVSVSIHNGKVVFLASSQNDSSYIGVLSCQPDSCGTLPLLAKRGFRCNTQAFVFNHGKLIVTGQSNSNYNIFAIALADGLEGIDQAAMQDFEYRVPRQSERIQHSDPVGIGLTVVAVAVVFLALLCISLILMGSSKLFARIGNPDNKAAKKSSAPKAVSAGSSVDNDVYAAIAAAIHLYSDELHDEEEGIITIQKVEREWTPWNAKFYNMNHYFSNRK